MNFTVKVNIPGGDSLSFNFFGDGTFYSVDHATDFCDGYTLELDANGDVWAILTSADGRRIEGVITRDFGSIPDKDTYSSGETFGFDPR